MIVPKLKKPVYSCFCEKCRRIVRTRPGEVMEMAMVHYQLGLYAKGERPKRRRMGKEGGQ